MPCWTEPKRSGRPEPYPPAVEAALRGDTVLALGSSSESLELPLVYGDGPLVQIATDPFRPTVLESLPSIAGYRLALYLRGTRSVTTEPAFSPEVLHPEVLVALDRSPDGVVFDAEGTTGTLRAFQGARGPGTRARGSGHSHVLRSRLPPKCDPEH